MQELLQASAARAAELALEVQKLRVASMVLQEVEDNISDPNLYRELSLLNRLMNKEIESETERKVREAGEDAAETELEARGIDRQAAQRILRVLTSIAAAGSREIEEPDVEEGAES